jgi:hypothetical protein
MTRFALGLAATCALGAYLMPEMAGGCLLVAAPLLYFLAAPRERSNHAGRE